MKFGELFKTEKPVIAMLHLKGNGSSDILERAKREIDIYYRNGVDAVMVENYFSKNLFDCEMVLKYLKENFCHKIYGLNLLGDNKNAFGLANKYNAKFIQIDSVCGHLYPTEDCEFAKELNFLRNSSKVVLLGGVRFKYQPVLSERTVEEDLLIGKTRCDAIVVTGIGTGCDTSDKKIKQFKEFLSDFPVIVGAGVTLNTAIPKLKLADGAIVGSWFKENHIDNGEVCESFVKQFMEEVYSLRNEIAQNEIIQN